MAGEGTALLIIRAWVEAGSSTPLRARLRWTVDVRRGLEHEATVIEIAAVHAAVDAWLAEALAADGEPGRPVTPP